MLKRLVVDCIQDDLLHLLLDRCAGPTCRDLPCQLLGHRGQTVLDLHLYVVVGFDKRVVDERVQERLNVGRILPQNSQHNLACLLENSLLLEDAECVDDVAGETEGHNLWHSQLGALLEDAVEVDVCNFARVRMDQDVVAVSVSQTDDVANH